MKRLARILLCFSLTIAIVITFHSSLTAQQKTDSLRTALKTEKEDTNKVNTLNAFALSFRYTKPDSTVLVAAQASLLAEKLGWLKGGALAYRNMGYGYDVQGVYSKALDNYLKSLSMAQKLDSKPMVAKIKGTIGTAYDEEGDYAKALDYYLDAMKLGEELGDKFLQAGLLGNIGAVYDEEGDYTKSLDFHLKELKIGEELGNKELQVRSLSNIALVYDDQGDFNKAIDYDMRALKIVAQLEDKLMEASILGNTATVYQEKKDFAKALDYFSQAMKIAEKIGDQQLQESNLSNTGTILQQQGKYPEALENYEKAMKIAKDVGDNQGLAEIIGNMGEFYTRTGKFKEAEEYLKRAIAMEDSIGMKNNLSHVEDNLSRLYDTIGDFKLSLLYYKKAREIKDTLFNMEKNKALTRKELTYEYDKKQAAEKAEQDEKDLKQRIITWSVVGGLLLVLVFAGFIFRSLRITRKQKEVIEAKSKVIEEKNKDILDSITYAKRLQDAILPPLSLIKQYLPESFVLYKPKDIVAGDFYWMERAGDTILIAAADCTGHGVPGAMVSVVCSNALNRTVKEFKITEPGKILDKVRELVLETFEKSEDNVQDGMDISLCCINTNTKEVQWSGAYNSLWYIKKGVLNEVAADKQPIGKVDRPVLFNTHSLKLEKGDSLYLFTDGYADQFGGPKGKKFKYKQLNEKLKVISEKPMAEQKNILEQTLEGWKGNLEQVDDILIIGIRV